MLVIHYLLRSGRLDKVILYSKRVYKRNLTRFSKALLVVFVMTTGLPLQANSHVFDSFHSVPNEEQVFPVPQGISNQLFYLQRDPDANTVIYKLNMKDGQLDNDKPVHVFWIRYAEKGEVKELSSLQRKLAYGITSRLISKGKYELKFSSYPAFPLYLVQSPKGNQYYVYANVKEKQLILNKVFVRVKKSSFCMPKVAYLEFSGKDAETGKALSHRIYM